MSCPTGSTLVPKCPYYSFIWATDKGLKTKSNLVLLSDASAPLTTCKKYIRGNAGLVSSKYTDYGGRYFFMQDFDNLPLDPGTNRKANLR
jgi:hypothetical protein